jgi:hypothetical protein
MRRLLKIAGVLVVIIGLPLYLVPQNSNEYFSWTTRTDISAAFLGGSYLAAAVIEFSAARERVWANARIAVPAILVFTLLTLFITLANAGQYNYNAPEFIQRAGTWAWLAVYVVVPPIMMIVLWLQSRQSAGDPPRLRPIPTVLRTILASGGVALAVGGVILITDPASASWMWPWTLSALTGRAFGAWMIGFGIAMVQIGWEADWRRARAAVIGAGALGVLQIVVLLRYLDDPVWTAPQTWLYAAVMISFVALGAYGWRAAVRPIGGAAAPTNEHQDHATR